MIACHKDSNFKGAQQFSPERWIDPATENFTVNVDSASIVVPFGVGRRSCPGKRFVEMEVVLLLAKVSIFISIWEGTTELTILFLYIFQMVLAFDVSFVKPLETEFEFLLAPKTPLCILIRE